MKWQHATHSVIPRLRQRLSFSSVSITSESILPSITELKSGSDGSKKQKKSSPTNICGICDDLN